QTGSKLPLIVQVTVETTGTMLLGTEIAAALTALEPYGVIDVVGMNCATGPVEMTEHVRYLCQTSEKFVSVLPNAGLPELRDGKPWYPLTPEEFVRHHKVFVNEFGSNIAGGCCGTTPEHIRLLGDALDVSVDFTGRDGVPDKAEVVSRFRTQVTLPIFLDSTEPQVIEAGLKLLGGRAVINSINLEEGTGPETRLFRNLALAKKFGS